MNNWVKDAANTDITPAIENVMGWGPRRYLTCTHSAWLLVHGVILHGLGAWLTYSATAATQNTSRRMMSEEAGLSAKASMNAIDSALRQGSVGSFVTTLAWCLVAYACCRVFAEALLAQPRASKKR